MSDLPCAKRRILLLGFNHVIRLALGGQPKMATQSSDRVNYLLCMGIDLVFGSTYIQFHKIWWLPQGTKRQYV